MILTLCCDMEGSLQCSGAFRAKSSLQVQSLQSLLDCRTLVYPFTFTSSVTDTIYRRYTVVVEAWWNVRSSRQGPGQEHQQSFVSVRAANPAQRSFFAVRSRGLCHTCASRNLQLQGLLQGLVVH